MFHAEIFLKEQFRTPEGLRRFLTAYGAVVPEPGTAQKWFSRGSLPARWLGLLCAYLELERGAPVSLARYMVDAR